MMLMYLACVALCVYGRYTGDRDAPLTWSSTLAYDWAIAMDGKVHNHPIKVRADNASSQGILIPEHWRTAVRCRDLASRATEAARKAEAAADGIADVDCAVAGVPKPQLPHEATSSTGDVVQLRTPTGPMNFLLRAHIAGDMWYCHAGS